MGGLHGTSPMEVVHLPLRPYGLYTLHHSKQSFVAIHDGVLKTSFRGNSHQRLSKEKLSAHDLVFCVFQLTELVEYFSTRLSQLGCLGRTCERETQTIQHLPGKYRDLWTGMLVQFPCHDSFAIPSPLGGGERVGHPPISAPQLPTFALAGAFLRHRSLVQRAILRSCS